LRLYVYYPRLGAKHQGTTLRTEKMKLSIIMLNTVVRTGIGKNVLILGGEVDAGTNLFSKDYMF
jgi:hypothetical protein